VEAQEEDSARGEARYQKALAAQESLRKLMEEVFAAPPPPPPPRTNWTRRVPHPVLIGHAASEADGRGVGCTPRPPRAPTVWGDVSGKVGRRGVF